MDELTVMQAAVDQTGLHDFGDDSFREGLGILLSSLEDEAHLNTRGYGFFHQRIVGHLAQRLLVEDWYSRHPEIDDVPIVSPLIGVGLPRTGSTALSMLLAQDPDVRFLRKWESAQPCPPPSTVEGVDPRIPTDGGEMVGTRRHVPSDANGPMECHELMSLDFKAHIFVAFAQIPTYASWLVEDADLIPTFAYQRRVMKLLQWGEPTRPWRLKCPSHVLFLNALNHAFPDATFVMTHRDPTDVLLSACDLYADIIGAFTDTIDSTAIGELNVAHWSLGMQRVVAFRQEAADQRFYDIDFGAMQADPIGEIRGLYSWLGVPVGEVFEERMQSWWTQSQEDREPNTHADPVAFGLDLDAIRPLFADYVACAHKWTSR